MRAETEGAHALRSPGDRGALTRLADVASVDIGFVTGANDFFLLTLADAKRYGLSRRVLRPAIARPGQLRGAILRTEDGTDLVRSERCLLLSVGAPGVDERATAVGRYLRRGRRHGIHRGYKCRVRTPWYSVPGVRVPDAFMSLGGFSAAAVPGYDSMLPLLVSELRRVAAVTGRSGGGLAAGVASSGGDRTSGPRGCHSDAARRVPGTAIPR